MRHMKLYKSKLAWYFSWRAAIRYLKREGVLKLIKDLSEVHPSTGADLGDYAVLHHYIKTSPPRYFLECGTGLTTHVIAHAMERYSLPKFPDARLISMEGEEAWYREALKHKPNCAENLVEMHYSPTEIYDYSFVSGMVYRDTPDLPYDVVFVDGPDPAGKCDLDYIKVVANSSHCVRAFVDSRRSSVLAYAALLGRNNIVCYPFGMATIKPVGAKDLITASTAQLHRVFDENIRWKQGTGIYSFPKSLLLGTWPVRLD